MQYSSEDEATPPPGGQGQESIAVVDTLTTITATGFAVPHQTTQAPGLPSQHLQTLMPPPHYAWGHITPAHPPGFGAQLPQPTTAATAPMFQPTAGVAVQHEETEEERRHRLAALAEAQRRASAENMSRVFNTDPADRYCKSSKPLSSVPDPSLSTNNAAVTTDHNPGIFPRRTRAHPTQGKSSKPIPFVTRVLHLHNGPLSFSLLTML